MVAALIGGGVTVGMALLGMVAWVSRETAAARARLDAHDVLLRQLHDELVEIRRLMTRIDKHLNGNGRG